MRRRPARGVQSSAVQAVPQARGVVRAFDALRPCYGETKRWCVPSQASSGRSDQLQLARPVSSGRRGSHFHRRTEPRTKGPASTPSSTRAACGGPTSNPAAAAFPLGRPCGQTRATGITHPGFYGGKPWRKPDNTVIITERHQQEEGFRHPPPPNIAATSFTAVDDDPPRSRRPVTPTTFRGSARAAPIAAAPASPALSACRTGLSRAR